MTLLAATDLHRGEFLFVVCVAIAAAVFALFAWAALSDQAIANAADFPQPDAPDFTSDAEQLAKKRGQR